MKMTVNEFAKLSGISVRTVHYYDRIGLLKPTFINELNGYRFYDETSVQRIQEILFYRELDFPLKSIQEILSSPLYNQKEALSRQKELLILKKERIDRLISAIDKAEKGESIMDAFDNSKFETVRKEYEKEAKEKWGHTEAFREYESKNKNQADIFSGIDGIMKEFSLCMNNGNPPSSPEAQLLVKKLKDYITQNLYTCTDEILSGLGKMYVADERFTKNIDSHAKGTAGFISKAIESFCR